MYLGHYLKKQYIVSELNAWAHNAFSIRQMVLSFIVNFKQMLKKKNSEADNNQKECLKIFFSMTDLFLANNKINNCYIECLLCSSHCLASYIDYHIYSSKHLSQVNINPIVFQMRKQVGSS